MKRNIGLVIKRMIDLVGSVIGVILLSPLLLIIFMVIKITSPGEGIFKQERLGKNGKVFEIFKFRTMVVNAQEMGDGLSIKSETDSRITKVGKFLRATSLDELPQLLNVIKGNMSLVGPRPPVTYHPYKYEEYSEFQKQRFIMRPGITGLAQVTVRNSVSWDERIIKDVEYISTFSIYKDIKILLQTVYKVFRKDNVYGNTLSQIKNIDI